MWASGRSDPPSRSHEPCLPGVSPLWLVILGLPVIRWPVFPAPAQTWPGTGSFRVLHQGYGRAYFFDD